MKLSKLHMRYKSFLQSGKEIYLSNRSIANILIIFLLFGLILWRTNDNTKDFGLNFFTEVLGVFITVLVIEQIIKKREEQKLLPQKLAAYEDIRLFVSRYLSFWLSTYKLSVPGNAPEDIQTFFSETGMGKIWTLLDLNSKPHVAPDTTWWEYLPKYMNELHDLGDKILDRHNGHLDPGIYGEVHFITESPLLFAFKYMQSIKHFDLQSGFPRPSILSSYSPKPQIQDYEAITKLYEWCIKSYEELQTKNPYMKKVSEYNPISNSENLPPCMISIQQALKEAEALQKFRAQKNEIDK